jgi:DNA-binding response OmpR family regulator
MKLKDKKILLVEDDQLIGNMYERYFKIDGAKVTWVFNGEDAMEIVDTDDFDVIVTDLMMPRVDGFEVLKRVNAGEKTKNIPFVMLTNKFMTEEEIAVMKKAGADGYITKSEVNLKEVVEKIVEVLEKKKRQNT